ncbi:unnamed protein product [Didymodactylos carnosus]|uniref:Uncharacterized protein n=1 Tax=Didymodactylos carnosus TaxID=1234261 RepID=A0A814B636_9BILA|nr:unnamed protein product [Didymodactylos carnosus]CAF1093091.1 unnamed protein product [Didymodactylos carnosus]CAF3702591.1 unnamed protein product [Didymodactylos carnosus]CAF3854582.1 unnamed protein product [Didymodactylos carnosus]
MSIPIDTSTIVELIKSCQGKAKTVKSNRKACADLADDLGMIHGILTSVEESAYSTFFATIPVADEKVFDEVAKEQDVEYEAEDTEENAKLYEQDPEDLENAQNEEEDAESNKEDEG